MECAMQPAHAAAWSPQMQSAAEPMRRWLSFKSKIFGVLTCVAVAVARRLLAVVFSQSCDCAATGMSAWLALSPTLH
jgi:hypothetical protein